MLPGLWDTLRGRSGSIVLVVSLLVALMKNQVDVLQKRGVRAAYADDAKPCSRFNDEIHEGQYQVVYFSPEMLLTDNDWRDIC